MLSESFVTMAWHNIGPVDGADRLHVWRIAGDNVTWYQYMLNSLSQIADKEWSFSLGVGCRSVACCHEVLACNEMS